mmetsp:Transcript_5976/g.25009  ORF Transcript_5976/g.25009 Transcript_5976/m.25009 type:complete len:161 (-) Transcript_5976:80-562(-)
MTVKRLAPAVALGVGGLVPFVALSRPGQERLPHEALWLRRLRTAAGRRTLNATECQVTYGCAILSFLGGPHWGFALAAAPTRLRTLQIAWGVVPALIAWPCASLPAPASLDGLSVGLGLSLVVDAVFAALRCVPPLYVVVVRAPLTAVAIAALRSNRDGS